VLTLGDPGQNQQMIAQLKNVREICSSVARLFFSVDVNSKTKFSRRILWTSA
jgi:hypothetical protein